MRSDRLAAKAATALLSALGALMGVPIEARAQDASGDVGPAWVSACIAPGRAEAASCFMEKRVALHAGGGAATERLFLTLRFDVAAPGQPPSLSVRAPLGLDLPAGIRLGIDDRPPVRLDFRSCDPNGCLGAAPVAADELAALVSGRELTLRFETADGRGIEAAIPLAGFATAYARVQ